MLIPAYIIDDILKERARRNDTVLEELQIELDIPRETTTEQIEEKPQRGVEEVDFFV